ncbi:MAG: XdhC family protein [Eubacteriales bacterium]|nr:XdhC family protein [Eubacteriales bacterium]
MSIFQEIKNCRGKKAVTAALLDGETAGEKLLLADGELVWSSGEGFLYSHLDSLKEASETGVQEIAGKQVYFDCVSSQKKLVICGAGHVSMPIIALGKMLGFRVTVLEDRPSFADNARRAGADEVICENFVDGLSHAEGGTDSYFVVVTRGHRYDEICLGEILKKKYAYVGMMGSRARSAIVKRNLVELGFPKEQVEAVHTPIGLDISAESPEEIAVSIMGEIIAHKNSRKRSFGYPDEFLDELLKLEEEGRDAVLCTIVRRRGSAPREVGTKMIVRTDGQMIGTIGGGCMEAAVRTRALHMLRSGETQPQICNVNMTAADAEDEGMVCGGNIDVWLEVLR